MAYWLIKSEPEKYPWEKLVADGQTFWDGVRNYAARNNLRAMKKDDLLLYYHSGGESQIVGLAKVVKEAYQDPTTDDTNWVCVDVAPVQPLPQPVTLAQVKAVPELSQMALVRLSRLSVGPVTPIEYDIISKMAGL